MAEGVEAEVEFVLKNGDVQFGGRAFPRKPLEQIFLFHRNLLKEFFHNVVLWVFLKVYVVINEEIVAIFIIVP